MNKYEWLRQQVESIRTNPVTACVEWPFTRIPKGYGQVWTGKRQITAHRAAYAIFNGIEPEHYVCHHCDNPPCFNPYHLYDGTPEDNAIDMVRRGRANGGEKKLTETHVQEIVDLLQDSNLTQKEIGKQFGVTHSVISNINNGHAWKHVPRRIPIRKGHIKTGNRRKLDEQQIEEVGCLLRKGIRQADIAAHLDVSPTLISSIKSRRFSHINVHTKLLPSDGRCKLTDQDVVEIIKLLKIGNLTQAEIAQRFNIAENTVGNIKCGATRPYIHRPKEWPSQIRGTNRILIEDQVTEIIALLHEGILTYKELGQRFDISHWTIRDIKRGRTWKHIYRPWLIVPFS